MALARSCGILLHPTSLPGRFGIGDFGPSAVRFVDFLVKAGQKLWQVLPLGPTGYADSPYQSFSAFGGNPLLISPERLYQAGLLNWADLDHYPSFPADRVDYGRVIQAKSALLERAFSHFRGGPEYDAFVIAQADWLDDYALFAALKQAHNGTVWNTWEPALVHREPEALACWQKRLSRRVDQARFAQFVFFTQWHDLLDYAHTHGIRLIGDVPIFVAHDSADVWSHPELFYLDENGNPTAVAGVPPDYFSATGQLWGNPLYRWDVLAHTGYAWWIDRVRAVLTLVDIIRLDHFRGFEAYWSIPTPATTAIRGAWVPGPGAGLFIALEQALGPLPFIAENLGVITPPVEALRQQFGFPGMRIFQFAFTFDRDPNFLPHRYERNTVAYPGTHDNDTTVGWFAGLDGPTRARVQRYTGTDGSQMNWDFIRLLLMSVADTVLYPLQDVLGLGTEARMNLPGTSTGNWTWRFTGEQLTEEQAIRLADMATAYER